MTALIAFFVRRDRLVQILTFGVLLVGILALSSVRYESFPKVSLGAVNITTARPGAGPEDMELAVTVPLEEEILDVAGVERLVSRSMEGLSVVTARLDPDLDEDEQDEVVADLQKAVDRARARLPADLVTEPEVRTLDSDELPVMDLHVTGTAPEAKLREVARTLADGLRELEGVARVTKLGYRKPEIRIALDPIRAARLGIAPAEVAAAVQLRNVRETGGAIDSIVAERNVVVVGSLRDAQDVSAMILRGGGPDELGNQIRVRDVADVFVDYEDWQVQMRLDGELSIAIRISKEGSADGFDVAQRIRDYVEVQRARMPGGVELVLVNDTTRFTRDLLRTLLDNAVLGLILLLIVLRLFFDWRLSFWIAMGLPVSMALTFAAMALSDISVNLLTLTAMVLVLGMLVDDAIVTGESIYAARASSACPKQAAVEGASVVARPVIISTATTILAFAPIAFLGGLEGKFMWTLPVVIGIALTSSLFDCTALLPGHLTHGSRAVLEGDRFGRLRQVYALWLARLLRRPLRAVLAFLALATVIAGLSGAALRFNLYPEMEIDTFHVKVELPAGTSFAHTQAETRALEQMIRTVIPPHELAHITTEIGHHDTDPYGGTEGRSSAWALLTIYLAPRGERDATALSRLAALRERTAELEGFSSLLVEPLDDTPTPAKPIELDVIGEDGRDEVVAEIVDWLATQPGVTAAYTSDAVGKPTVRVSLRHPQLAAHGLTVRDVSQAVRMAFDGVLVGSIQTRREVTYLRLVLDEEHRGALETLRDLQIPLSGRPPVHLENVALLRYEPGDAVINHAMGDRSTTIYGDIDRLKTDVATINRALEEHVEASGVMHGRTELRLYYGGERKQQAEALGDFGIAGTLAIVLVYVVLALLFDSYLQPFLVMSVLPFGFVGVMLGFALQGFELSLIALIGIVGLTGVLVNDSVVLVSRLNDRRRELGEDFLSPQEVAFASSQRLRPILITSITTMAGLFPTAYGVAGSSTFIAPMVMAIAWGVLFGTAVTLVLLPCLYSLEQRLRRRLRTRLDRRASTRRG